MKNDVRVPTAPEAQKHASLQDSLDHKDATSNGAPNSSWKRSKHGGISWIKRYLAHIPFLALFSFIGCAVSIGLMATAALFTHSPFVFPSLGPTAFLFFSNPTTPAASPRNTIIGHTIGVLAGYFSLVVTGLTVAGPALRFGVTPPRIIAITLSLGLTAGLMILLRASHPPAGATTLIISLGILTQPWQLGVLMSSVVLLTLFAVLVNRLAGIPYPLWKTFPNPTENVEAVRIASVDGRNLREELCS